MKNKEQLLILGMVLTMLLWGFSWPSNKMIVNTGDVFSISFLRFFISVLTMIVIIIVFKIPLKINLKATPTLIASGLFMAIYSLLFIKGLQNGKPGAGGILVTTLNPFFANILYILIKRKIPNKNIITGLILGFISTLFLLKLWQGIDSIFQLGNIYFILSSFVWAILSRFTSHGKEFAHPAIFSLGVYFLALIQIFPLSNFNDNINLLLHSNQLFYWNLFFSAAITTGFATTFFFYGTSELGPEKASSFMFLVPVFAGIGAWLFLDEIITWNTIIGGIIGIVSIYLIQTSKKVA